MKTKLKDMPPKLKLVILAALGIFGVLLVIIGSSGGKKAVAQKNTAENAGQNTCRQKNLKKILKYGKL